jgi:hypothetical protein
MFLWLNGVKMAGSVLLIAYVAYVCAASGTISSALATR